MKRQKTSGQFRTLVMFTFMIGRRERAVGLMPPILILMSCISRISYLYFHRPFLFLFLRIVFLVFLICISAAHSCSYFYFLYFLYFLFVFPPPILILYFYVLYLTFLHLLPILLLICPSSQITICRCRFIPSAFLCWFCRHLWQSKCLGQEATISPNCNQRVGDRMQYQLAGRCGSNFDK